MSNVYTVFNTPNFAAASPATGSIAADSDGTVQLGFVPSCVIAFNNHASTDHIYMWWNGMSTANLYVHNDATVSVEAGPLQPYSGDLPSNLKAGFTWDHDTGLAGTVYWIAFP